MKYCEHNYPIPDPDKLPHKRTLYRIEVCEKCAVKSSLQEMGSGIKLSPEIAEELKLKLKEIHQTKEGNK